MRFTSILTAAVVSLGVSCAAPERGADTPAWEHARLDSAMRRDLSAYFAKRDNSPVQLSFAYLRQGPTITGVAYPRYYLWVTARDSDGRLLSDGAARVAEIDSIVEVTHFLPRAYIVQQPGSLDSVFPAPVVAEIRKRM